MQLALRRGDSAKTKKIASPWALSDQASYSAVRTRSCSSLLSGSASLALSFDDDYCSFDRPACVYRLPIASLCNTPPLTGLGHVHSATPWTLPWSGLVDGTIACNRSVSVVLPAPLLWLGWPCAAPPPPLLRALGPIPFGVGVICDFFFLLLRNNRSLFVIPYVSLRVHEGRKRRAAKTLPSLVGHTNRLGTNRIRLRNLCENKPYR